MPMDANHSFIYGEDISHGTNAYNVWKNTKRGEDLDKIKVAMNG